MGRGNDQAQAGAKAGVAQNQTLFNSGQSLYGALAPELQAQMAHPAGIDPVTLAKMKTSNAETAGGTQGAAAGAGALLAGRTRNAGSADAAIAESARGAGQQLSTANQKTDIANAGMKEKQREQAIGGLEGLYGVNTGAANNALGEVANNTNANTNAENASWNWAKYILDPMMQASGQAASGYLGKK